MSGADESKPDEIVEEPRRSREEILREFKLALAIGDGSLLEADKDRARGVDPYDNRLGGRRAHGNGPASAPGGGPADGPDQPNGGDKAPRRR